MLSNGGRPSVETKGGESGREDQPRPSHINYVQDVARCKCNTNWTGLLIIIHWRHLLAYLTSLLLLSPLLPVPLHFFLHSPRPPFFVSFSRPFLFNLIIRSLSLFLSVRRFDRGSKREFVVDYYLLNASAKTDPGRI